MTDELGDAFDQASESDDATNALFRQAETLDDTKRYAEGLFHEGALYSSPVVQGETDAARAAWQKAEKMSGGDVFGKAADGLDHLAHDKPADLWEKIEPDHDFGPYAEPAIDEAGTVAIESVQMGADVIDSMNPASNWQPAAQLVRDEWQEAKNVDLDEIPWKDPEIPDTDAVGADVVTDALPAAPDTDAIVAAAPDTSSYDTSSYDASSYDASSYETSASYDTSSYDTSSSDSSAAFGPVDGDDAGSSFTDGF